jgi:hypothetical protein
MISGRQALAQVEQAVGKLRRQEAQLEQASQSAIEEVTRLRFERTEGYRELARLKLDAIRKNEIDRELDAAEQQAMNLIESRRQALQALTERRRQAEERVHEAEARRHGAAEALETALDQIDALRKSVEGQMRVSPEWAASRARVDEIAGMAQQAERKAAQAEADREEKRRPYEADPLFMYLWARKFGTPAYRVNPFSRFMDRLVARVVGYDKARANYALLNEIPERLREHAQRVSGRLVQERARLTALERAALEKAGIKAQEAKAVAARTGLDDAERALSEAREALASFDRSYDASVLEGDLPFRDAVELLAEADAREDLRSLLQEALATPDPRDEGIVRRLQENDDRMTLAVRRAAEAHGRLKQAAQRRAEVEAVLDDLRHRGYDAPYGQVGNEAVLGNVLGGVLAGSIGGAILREVLRGGFHRGPSPWDSDFGGGLPFPPPGGFETGGTFGGGGDGFRTGGRF